MDSAARLQERFNELVRLAENINQPYSADRIDLLCQSIILESRISRTPSPLMAEERVIREIENHVRKDVTGYYDFDLLARKYDLHPAKFRRYWNRYIGLPPARYMMKLRMAEAARLLVETAMPVGEVARTVGFMDELYFSKKFRKEYGLPATAYRQNHHKNLSLKDLPVTRM
jgi:transcriptional regulator GlxA family with amidase domain